FHAENISGKGLNGTDAQFFTPNSSFTAHINIPGAHMVYNALAATAVGYALGMTDREICAGIEANVPIAGRNNLI
ncbi:Mur ligase family protein, partial [Veillonella parvula]|nr:Mur ligase family protein [Veillonella parvula]